jgi:hypothetical protein
MNDYLFVVIVRERRNRSLNAATNGLTMPVDSYGFIRGPFN